MTVHIPLSSIEEIVWPALVGGEQAMYLALQFQLEQSQWWPEDELVSAQLQQLSLLLQHAVKTVPYYKQRFTGIPFDFLGRLSLNEWRRLPILTRDELQKAGSLLNSKAVPKRHGSLFTQSSSGSTGKPVSIKQTTMCSIFWRALTLRESLWHQRDMRGKLAVIRNRPNASGKSTRSFKADGWGAPFDSIYETGAGVYINSSVAIPEQAEWLLREQPDYLLAYPSILQELACFFIENKLELAGLKQARTFGEALLEETRLVCRQAWGVPVIDGYSSKEVGNIAFQCPAHEHYHIQSESVLLEILDDAGNPCRPGETGRVIATPLHNFATPLLRYEVGDLAEAGKACDCGRGLPVINRVLGRNRNLATAADGRKFWPELKLVAFQQVAPIKQVQLVQHSLEHIGARLVAAAKVTPEQEGELAGLIQKQFGSSFQVTFTYLDKIPRSSTDKYEDFYSEV